MTVAERVDLAGVCTGDGPCDTTPVGTGKNWITKGDPVGGLGQYGRAIVHALLEDGHSKSEAVRLMWGVLRDWAAGKGHVTPATRVRAAKELAHLKALQASAHSHARDTGSVVDLGVGAYAGGHPFFGNQYTARAGGGSQTIYGNQHSKSSGSSSKSSSSPKAPAVPAAEKAYLTALHNAEKQYLQGLQKSEKAYLQAAATAAKDQAKMTALGQKNALRSAMKVTAASTTAAQTVNAMTAGQRTLMVVSHEVPAGYSWTPGNGSYVLVPATSLAQPTALSGGRRMALDLAVDQAQREAAKSAGLTFPGTTSYPLAGPDGKFSRSLADKAVKMVQLGNVASAQRIRVWLMGKFRANGAADLIPANWKSDGSIEMSLVHASALELAVSGNMVAYNPQGDERMTVLSNLRAIKAIRKSGRSAQADGLEAALVRSKSSRARKMPDGSRRAHTPTEVRIGLDKMRGAT